MAGGLRGKQITGDPTLELVQEGQPSEFWPLISHGICMRRCSLQTDMLSWIVYLKEHTAGGVLEGRFLSSLLSLPFSNALCYCCILRA